ncbi:MAG: hypothetical protein QXU14_07025 [Metallosphaera sp.]
MTVVINSILSFVIFANVVTTAINSFVLIGVSTFVVWMIAGVIYGYVRRVST